MTRCWCISRLQRQPPGTAYSWIELESIATFRVIVNVQALGKPVHVNITCHSQAVGRRLIMYPLVSVCLCVIIFVSKISKNWFKDLCKISSTQSLNIINFTSKAAENEWPKFAISYRSPPKRRPLPNDIIVIIHCCGWHASFWVLL